MTRRKTLPSMAYCNIGFQAGEVIVKNLIDFHSYMPGMGVNYGSGTRIQGIVRIKYKLK